jgi:hypothetical protein
MLIINLLVASYIAAPASPQFGEILPFDVVSNYAGSACNSILTQDCKHIYDTQVYKCDKLCLNGTVLIRAEQNKKTGAYAMITMNHDLQAIFLSFRGTKSLKNAITDIFVWYSESDWELHRPGFFSLDSGFSRDMKVHYGFEKLYLSVREQLQTPLNEYAKMYPEYSIIFTGHSLGAALATLAAVDFYQLYGFENRIWLYAYARPRVGNKSWADYVDQLPFADRIYRITRKGDPIPHLPSNLIFGYTHCKQQYQITDEGGVFKCKNDEKSGESSACLNDILYLNPTKHSQYFGMRDEC